MYLIYITRKSLISACYHSVATVTIVALAALTNTPHWL